MSREREARSSPPNSSEQVEKKRKRNSKATSDEELEIDINLPEPPSKKARRKEKKAKTTSTKATDFNQANGDAANGEADASKDTATPSAKRSEFGIWIGNLHFSTTSEKLKDFLFDKGHINEDEITRVNLPTPPGVKAAAPTIPGARPGPANRGFAYIDFSTKEAQDKAVALSETLLVGRPVLIKDSKSFEGRPQKTAESGDAADHKPPSRKVFVGNLAFDVNREDLINLLGKAGPIEDCFLATFEDSGKCKGFGWMRFKTLEAAQAAVRGYVYERETGKDDEAAEEADQATKKKASLRKRTYVNKLFGRVLRCEFAEDEQTRYKKRFGKGAPKKGEGRGWRRGGKRVV